MKCSHCQIINPATARFCLNCGAVLNHRCANCQMELPTGARFCMNCGKPVPGKDAAEDERYDNFVASAPAPLVKKARAAAHLTGERRIVTAMFVDIAGSTALAEQVGKEAWREILDGALDLCSLVIYRYEGTIARQHGDELLAFFGAPVAHEDDPVRAVHAALELLESLRDYAEGIARKFGLDFSVRISLSTGPVVIGLIGSDLKYEYSALGGAVNVAAKIEATKQSMAVLVSETTYRLVAPFFDFSDLGEFIFEGQSEPVRIFQVRGGKTGHERTQGYATLESSLVGRNTELASLSQLSQAVQAGLGRVALVVGEPGIGKTRLITEWRQAVAAAKSNPSILWAEGHNHSYHQGLAYHLLIDLLHSLLGIPAEVDEPETRAALRALIEELFGPFDESMIDAPALDVYPYLGHLLSLKLDGLALERVKVLDPPGMRAQYLAALRQLLRALADRGPLIVILENLQWADPSSTELLTSLMPLIPTMPMLFCLVTRPNRDVPGWRLVTAGREAMGGRFTEISLKPLSEADSWQLVSNLLESDILPTDMRSPILSRSEGFPYFIEEVLRMLIDRGAIVQKDGNWVAEAGIKTTEIPDNLHRLLLARIDCLSEEEKRTLRVAAVVGRQFPTNVLERVMGSEESRMSLIGHLGALESAGLTRVAQVTPELIYTFQNALVQDVAYRSLLKTDRQKLHYAVGEALEELYPDQRASRELAPRLGQHFYAAGEMTRAFKYYTLAGAAALESYANREAESRYRMALDLAESDPDRASSLFGLGQALRGQSRAEECIQVWREAIDLYKTIGPESSENVARLYAHSARAAWEGGNTPESLRLCQEGLETVADAPDSAGLAQLIHEAARAYLFNGLDEARQLCQKALEMATRLEIVELQADALATMGLLPDQQSESALQALSKAVEIAESAGLLNRASRAHTNLAALLANRKQEYETARDHYRRAAALRHLKGSKAGELLCFGGVAEVSLLLGDLDETRAIIPKLRDLLSEVIDPGPGVFHFRKIEAQFLRYQGDLPGAIQQLRVLQAEERQRGNLQNLIEVNTQLAEILLEAYSLQAAAADHSWEEAERSLVEAREISEGGIGGKVWLCCLFSMICVCQDRFEDARLLQEEAREAASQVESPVDWGWLSLAQARLATAEKRWVRALDAFDKAVEIFTKLKMRWWRARVMQDWAEMYTARGIPADSERAQALLREALSSFEEMGAGYYEKLIMDQLRSLEAKSFSQALAHQKMAQEMAKAGKLQEDFLPREAPHILGYQVAATLKPARETSGDFYDFIPLPGGRWGIIIADVADKGAGAALYMTLSRTLIRTFAGEYPNQPESVLTAVNRRILSDTPANLFVTAFYGILDPATGSFVYCNAGHNPPYYLDSHEGNQIHALTRTGLPLGIFADRVWENGSVQLGTGDILILYTDGIVDAQNSQEAYFGKEGLLGCVQSSPGHSAQEIQDMIIGEINEFSADTPLGDDLTLVVLVRTDVAAE